jgi:hypothetical protein
LTYESEEPFFQEKGKIMGQKDIGDNRSQITFSGEGAMKGNIEVTNSGDFIEVQKGNNVTHAGCTKGPICPSISNVLVAALEGCATAVVDIVRPSNIKKVAKTG